MDYLAGIFELLGLWTVGNKRRYGFIITITGLVCWLMYVILTNSTYGLMIIVIPAIVINFRNFIKWGRENEKEAKKE